MSNLPERFDLTSQDPSLTRMDGLRSLFPDVFHDGKVDVDTLRRDIGDWAEIGPERFGLNWPGKAECMRVIQEPSLGTLVPMREESVDFDGTQNVVIEGENLETLKLLQKAYYGKVKMIYIDPPYNTGHEFIYPDNFREGLADYLRYSGQVDSEGFKLSANAETDGRYHSKWLSMMYPRLFLARNLLRDDGVIFISIDDHEFHNLRALMNEIFGEENFVATVIWQKVYAPKSSARYVSEDHDYILMFARDTERLDLGMLPRTAEQDAVFTNPDDDPRGRWRPNNLAARNYYSKGTYSVTCPGGRVIAGPPAGSYWRISEAKLRELDADGRIWWGASGNNVPAPKIFLSEVKQGRVIQTLWKYEDVGHTQEAKKQLLELVHFESSDTVFDTPKPSRLIERMLKIATTPDAEDIVLDFFAGSGTTGDAVMRINREDGGNRRYVMVQIPEPTGDGSLPTLAAMVRERVRAAGARLDAQAPELGALTSDRGFRSFRLMASNFQIWKSETADAGAVAEQLGLLVDHIVADRSHEAVLSELLLKAGYPLTSKVEILKMAEVEVYSVAEGALLVCLADLLRIELFEAMVEAVPAMILVLDAGFGGSDELKVNALQTVRARNQRTGSDIVLRVV
jgi:adenine-specific DNA-methyltransferase